MNEASSACKSFSVNWTPWKCLKVKFLVCPAGILLVQHGIHKKLLFRNFQPIIWWGFHHFVFSPSTDYVLIASVGMNMIILHTEVGLSEESNSSWKMQHICVILMCRGEIQRNFLRAYIPLSSGSKVVYAPVWLRVEVRN